MPCLGIIRRTDKHYAEVVQRVEHRRSSIAFVAEKNAAAGGGRQDRSKHLVLPMDRGEDRRKNRSTALMD